MSGRRGAALALVALGALVAALGGCSSGAGSDENGQVVLRVGDQKGASLQDMLAAAGQLDGLTYKVKWSLFTSGPPILEGINAGSVDFGVVGNTPPVFAAASGARIVLVGATTSRLTGQAIVVPKDSPVRTPADLKGKKVAVAKGSSANYHLLSVLTKNGLKFGDVQPQYLQPADALTALTGGRVDAWATWEPYTAQAELQNGARILADGTGYTNGYGFQVTSKDTLKNKARSAALKDFLSRYQRAVRWSSSHPEQWAAIWAKQTRLAGPVAERAVRRRLTTVIPIDDSVIAAEQQIADSFAGVGLVPRKVAIAGFFDRRFNDLAVAARPQQGK
ncbi:ABC transporter substrate-binding protein [Actinomadura chibensis]|uniref:Putative aliphatic sulfonates-binding protein n=1 Tax=Actinomadura chibensis TaxID=392828 RepID=A0A5D0NIU2_9ACTN|nr:ABC transporter substrate-binding protein [Actinomadura chibensis]TYB44121.1 ABC transporter substrate-binding protein [Actinomadura chibensis]